MPWGLAGVLGTRVTCRRALSRKWRSSASAPGSTSSMRSFFLEASIAPQPVPLWPSRSMTACRRSAHPFGGLPVNATASRPSVTSADAQSIARSAMSAFVPLGRSGEQLPDVVELARRVGASPRNPAGLRDTTPRNPAATDGIWLYSPVDDTRFGLVNWFGEPDLSPRLPPRERR